MLTRFFHPCRHLLSTSTLGFDHQVCRSITTGIANSSLQSEINAVGEIQPFDKIPGPPSWPLLQMAPSLSPGGRFYYDNLLQTISKLHEEYGPIVRMLIPFQRPVVFITSVEDTEKLLHHEGKYPCRDEFHAMIHHKRSINFGDGLAASEHEIWKMYRQLGQKVLGGPQSASDYLPHMNTSARVLTEKLASTRSECHEVENFSYVAKKWSFETMNMMVLGKALGIFDNDTEAHELFHATQEFFESATELFRSPPIWKFYPTKAYKRQCRSVDTMMNKCFNYVQEAMQNPIPSSMLAKLYEDVDNEQEHNQVVDILIDFLIGAIDTTSTALTFMLHYLAVNPEQQELARQEVRRNINPNGIIDKNSLSSLVFVKACLKETLRLRSVTSGIVRVIPEDLIFSGYQVPAGTKIIALNSITSLDEAIFQEPEKFRPERWIRNSPTYTQSPRWAYLPFGHGPRACIGRRFAEMELWVAAAHLLRRFRIETTTPDFDLVMKLIVVPDRPINMVFHDLH